MSNFEFFQIKLQQLYDKNGLKDMGIHKMKIY